MGSHDFWFDRKLKPGLLLTVTEALLLGLAKSIYYQSIMFTGSPGSPFAPSLPGAPGSPSGPFAPGGPTGPSSPGTPTEPGSPEGPLAGNGQAPH